MQRRIKTSAVWRPCCLTCRSWRAGALARSLRQRGSCPVDPRVRAATARRPKRSRPTAASSVSCMCSETKFSPASAWVGGRWSPCAWPSSTCWTLFSRRPLLAGSWGHVHVAVTVCAEMQPLVCTDQHHWTHGRVCLSWEQKRGHRDKWSG